MNDKIKLRLTVEVEYDPQGTTFQALKDKLVGVARYAYDNGLFTGETNAEIEDWTVKVQEIK